jgi:hypothetical protein
MLPTAEALCHSQKPPAIAERWHGALRLHIIPLAAILQMNGYSAKFYTSPLEALTAARSGAADLLYRM